MLERINSRQTSSVTSTDETSMSANKLYQQEESYNYQSLTWDEKPEDITTSFRQITSLLTSSLSITRCQSTFYDTACSGKSIK